jgi:hypothetical protein
MARKRKVRITNPFEDFISSANFLTDLTRKSRSVSKSEREDFLHNQTRLDFLCNLVSRLGILAYCYDSILKLTDQLRAWDLKVNALPPDPEDPDVTDMPEELAEE